MTGDDLQRLWQRIRSLVGRARITMVDDAKQPVQLLQLRLSANELLDPMPRLAEYGLASNPPDGTDAIVIFLGGDRAAGVAIATNHRNSRLKGLQRGEVAIHDDQGRWIWIKRNSIEIEAGGKAVDVNNVTVLTAKASTKIRLETPLVECTGDLTVTGTITGQTDVKAGAKLLKAHTHGGVTTGGGTSGPPT